MMIFRKHGTSPAPCLLASLFVLLAACGDGSTPLQELSGTAMGTSFSVKVVAPPAGLDSAELQQAIEQVLTSADRAMSTYLPDSELSRFNASRSIDWVGVSPELCSVVDGALSISALTGGAFDVTVGPLVNLWGFGPDGDVSTPPDAAAIDELGESVGYRYLHTDCAVPALQKDIPELYVDLSAYAKGHAVDEVAGLLDTRNVSNYLVEIGGELRLRGSNAKGQDWAIAIETPLLAGRSVQSVANLTDMAMATSGDYRNYFEHDGTVFSHAIDPRTGYPVTHDAASVTVVADTASFADALATALLVLGPEEGIALAERENIAAYFLSRVDGRIEEQASRRFALEVALR